jgi:hypothetical protein
MPGSGNSLEADATYSDPIDRIELLNSLGFVDTSYARQKARFKNAVCAMPHLAGVWTQAMWTIGAACFDVTLSYSQDVPDTTGWTIPEVFTLPAAGGNGSYRAFKLSVSRSAGDQGGVDSIRP